MTITVDPAAASHPFGVSDHCIQRFVTKPGEYTVYLGSSAGHTPHRETLTVE